MEGATPTRTDVHDRHGLPANTAPQAGQRGKNESADRLRKPVCRRSGKPSLTASPSHHTNSARIADPMSTTRLPQFCQSSARFNNALRGLGGKRAQLFRRAPANQIDQGSTVCEPVMIFAIRLDQFHLFDHQAV